MNARALVIVSAVLAFAVTAAAATASDHDGKYAGTISCDALPNDTPLHGAFVFEFTNGQVQYQRTVYQANTSNPLGVSEKGTGTVTPDGEVSLKGSASAKGWGYEAAYRGRFAGKNLELSGAQQWHLPVSGSSYTRPCAISVSPAK